MKILLTGGGTGGHVYPLEAVVLAMKEICAKNGIDLDLHYLGPLNEYSAILERSGVKMHSLASGKFRRYFSLANLTDVPKVFFGTLQALFKVLFIMPDVLFSKGGTGAFPVVFSAWVYRIPIVIHESDAVPGINTLLSSRFSRRIGISFASAVQYFDPQKVFLSGNPVRGSILSGVPDKATSKIELGFEADKPLLLFMGGSQGAQRINEFLAQALPQIIPLGQVLHQTGQNNFKDASKLAQAALSDIPLSQELKHRYNAVPYLDDKNIKLAYSAADLIIGRAGGSIAEIAAFGKPAIFIPLRESANNHQKENAYEFARTGAAVVIEENNLTEEILCDQIRKIISNDVLRESMEKASAGFYRPDAAYTLASEILEQAP